MSDEEEAHVDDFDPIDDFPGVDDYIRTRSHYSGFITYDPVGRREKWPPEVIQSSTNIPSIPFFSMPYEIQRLVLQKLSLASFRTFAETSVASKSLCESTKVHLPLFVEYIRFIDMVNNKPRYTKMYGPDIDYQKIINSSVTLFTKHLHFIEGSIEFNEEFAQNLLQHCRHVKADMLIIKNNVTCSSETLVQLLEVLGASSLDISHSPGDPGGFHESPSNLLTFPEIRKCRTLLIGGQKCSAEEFMDISCSFFRINIPNLHAVVVSRYIEEWVTGKREVGTFDIAAPEWFFDEFDLQLSPLNAFDLPPEPHRELVFYGVKRGDILGRIRIYKREFFTFTPDPEYIFP